MDITIKKLTSTDIKQFSELIALFEEVFEWEQPSTAKHPHLQKMLANVNFIVFIAEADSKLVGGLTAHVLQRYDCEKPSAYIYDIAVSMENQRKGIGTLLIASINIYCMANGFSEVYVQADMNDTQAINFYQNTAISKMMAATHFTYTFSDQIQ